MQQLEDNMATINQHTSKSGKKSYRVRIRRNGQLFTATFPNKTSAKAWANKIETEVRENRYLPSAAKGKTVADAIARYRVERERTDALRRADANALDWWKEHLGSVRLADLRRSHMIDGKDAMLNSGLAPATVARHMNVFSGCLSAAVDREWLEHNPMAGIPRPKIDNARTRYLSDGEREALLQATEQSESPDLHAAVVLALTTGGRQAETMGLTWDCVDFDRNTVHFPDTKNGYPRTVPLIEPARTLLLERYRAPCRHLSLVFPNTAGTGTIDLRRPWKAALTVAGIEDFRWHDLRHTAASYMVQRGCDLQTIAKVLGHRTLTMTQRYAHLETEHLRAAVDAIGDRMQS